MKKVHDTFQLGPMHTDSQNVAERAISAFKDYVSTGLSSSHKDFFFIYLVHAIATQYCHTKPYVAIKNQSQDLPLCSVECKIQL